MRYVLPLLATISLGCGEYVPTPAEINAIDLLPGAELVSEDWQTYEECGSTPELTTCWRDFYGPKDEFFSFNIDKWKTEEDFVNNVDTTMNDYKLENQYCPKGINQEFVRDYQHNSLVMILSDDTKYTADNLAEDYVNR